jgi:hypothetical protein
VPPSPDGSGRGATTPKTRQELYEQAKRRNIEGRSKMGREELLRALSSG